MIASLIPAAMVIPYLKVYVEVVVRNLLIYYKLYLLLKKRVM